jgi:hypothetical protein
MKSGGGVKGGGGVKSGGGRVKGGTVGALLQPTRRARAILLVLAAILAGFVCWFIGMDPAHAVGVTAAVVAIGFAWIAVPEHSDTRWPDAYPKTPDGARNDVLDLSWALRRQRGGIRERAFARIRGLAIERLAHRGLSLNNPKDRAAIENLIGPRPYAVLNSTSGRPPHLRTVEACLDALDRIDGETVIA